MTTIDNRHSDRFVSLLAALKNADNSGCQILVATLGTNGNGGQTALPEELLTAGVEGYKPATFSEEEFLKHCADAGIEGAGSPDDFLAYDRQQVGRDGYLTGLVERVYVDLVA